MSEQDTQDPYVIFIGNLPYSILDDEFHALVREHGNVVVATIVRDERERSRGFGFARFATPEEAEKAQAELNGREFAGRKLRVSLARRDSRYIELVKI